MATLLAFKLPHYALNCLGQLQAFPFVWQASTAAAMASAEEQCSVLRTQLEGQSEELDRVQVT